MTHNVNEDDLEAVATRWFGKSSKDLAEAERRVLSHAAARRTLTRDLSLSSGGDMTFGQKLADKVASFGGSWPFIIVFGVFLALWVSGNIVLVTHAFDPYPFIFLNLMLSMLAAIQAPVIMMSQNRQGEKDRLAAAHDYEVNLKAEIEIMALHEKLDQMRAEQMTTLLETQQKQIALLTKLLGKTAADNSGA